MVNEERVKLMTKLAIYENTKGRKQLNISKYYKRDYVRYNMYKTAVTATIAFIALITLGVLINAEAVLIRLNDLDFMNIAIKLGIAYVVFVALYMLAARLVYSRRYEKVKPDVIQYNHDLKRLKEMYDREEKEIKEKRAGRGVSLSHDNLNQY